MPRTPLGPITPNIIRRKELNPYIRGYIAGASAAGVSQYSIARELNVTRATIQTTLSRVNTRVDGESKPRSGRPKITIDREERIILRLARINPKQTYADLILRSGVNYSRKTVYRILSYAGITN